MYEPYEYTNYKHNKNKYSYPIAIEGISWNKQSVEEYMIEVCKFQTKHKIPNNKILVGEFGCFRKQKGIEKYFGDLISIFDKYEWHFALYAFREDSWDGMDYELGSKDLTWSYWQANENGKPYLSDVEVAQTTEISDLRRPVFKDKTGNTMSDFIPEIEIEEQSATGLPKKIIRFFSNFCTEG